MKGFILCTYITFLGTAAQALSLKRAERLDPDAIVFPEKPVQNLNRLDESESRYSTRELDCFNLKKVYYQDDCKDLLVRGTCDDGEWLVLDLQKVPQIVPKCEVKKCKNDFIYWPQTGECVFGLNQTMCTKHDTGLYTDVYGLGACECKKNSAKAMHSDGACYQLYTRGPCDPGFIFVENTKLETRCKRNSCHKKGNETYIIWPKDKKCYPLGSRGPCKSDEIFQVGVNSHQPACVKNLNNWHLIDLPNPNCDNFDQKGNCVDGVTVEPQGEEYLAQLLLSGKKRKKKSI